MYDAAQSLLSESGLTVSLGHLRFEDVIQLAQVSRSAAYRLWPYKEDFYDDFLIHLAGPDWQGTAAFDEETKDRALQVVYKRIDELDTAEGRRRALIETIREAVLYNFKEVSRSPQWRSYVALTATLVAHPEEDIRIRLGEKLRESEKHFLTQMAEFYEFMAQVLGLRLREPFQDFSVLVVCGAAVVEGMGLRQMVMPDITGKNYPLSTENGLQEWSLPAFTFLGVMDVMLEEDPRYRVDEARGKIRYLVNERSRRESSDI